MRQHLLIAAVMLALPAAANAQSSNAPPGNSGIDQYLESVPSTSGNRPTDTKGASGNGSSLPPRTARRLQQLGADGEAVQRLADAGTGSSEQGGQVSEGTGAQGRAPLPSVGRALVGSGGGDDDGMGAALPVILVVTLLGGIAAFVVRRRRSAG